MKFRFRAFGLHLLASVCVLALVWGTLYFGWYFWPGWYLTGALHIVTIMAAIDVVLGPLLTFVIAAPAKPRRELARDISIIVAVQLIAVVYGSITLWNGRPLYYTYSEKWLELVQASDISRDEMDLARQKNPPFAANWHTRPMWVWAPLPSDPKAANDIFSSAIHGGADVTQMPRLFKSYAAGLPEMRTRLKVVNTFGEFSLQGKKNLVRKLSAAGFRADQPIGMVMMGSAGPMLAVFDPATMQIKAWLTPD